MKIHILTLALVVPLATAPAANGAIGKGTALDEAVASFNKESSSDSIGVEQAPLTEEEVIAPTLLWERPMGAPVSDELFAGLKGIAETQTLPGNTSYESLTGYDLGGLMFLMCGLSESGWNRQTFPPTHSLFASVSSAAELSVKN